MHTIQFQWLPFSDLSLNQLYSILTLRAEVFVVEQNCPYLDPDGKDPHAFHLLGTVDHQLVAYLRLFPPTTMTPYVFFGRVVTSKSARKLGYGKLLMQQLLQYCNIHFRDIEMKCSAQFYLKSFYETFGLLAYGDIYDEDGISHIAMKK